MRGIAEAARPSAAHGLVWWTTAGAAVVLLAAEWLGEPTVPYLAATCVATAIVVYLTVRSARPALVWRLPTAVAAALFCLSALGPQRSLWRVEHRWPAYEGATLDAAAAELDRALGAAATSARIAARSALDAPVKGDAFAWMARSAAPSVEERAVVLDSGDTPVAWSGSLRVPLDSIGAGLGFVQTVFYDALSASAVGEGRRARVTVLLDARPPATGIATTLADGVVRRTAASAVRFTLVDGDAPPVADAALRLDDGRWLAARLAPLVPAEVQLRLLERTRAIGLLLLALIAAALLASVWGPAVPPVYRLGVLLVLLVASGRVPLNTLSNLGAIFDPSYYFAPGFGSFTGSVGALLMTSGILLLAVLTVRRRPTRMPRSIAGVVVLVVAVLGPFLLRVLARGISWPSRGASAGLWIAWEVALFLAGATLLIVGASAGRAALGRWRGVPLSVAPAIAIVAAVLAPPLLQASTRWPPWYPLLWIATVAALALARRSALIVVAAAAVAGCGAMTLVWGTSVRERVALADADVGGLTRIDPVVSALLDRFGDGLRDAPAPTSRAALVSSYAGSDLAAADYSVQLTAWDSLGAPKAQVSDVGAGAPLADLRALADSARAIDGTLRSAVAGPRGVRAALAVAHARGQVTTVAIAPRTRLLPEDAYAPLLAGAHVPAGAAPYSLALVGSRQTGRVLPQRSIAEATPAWSRRSDALHGDWQSTVGAQPVAVHVEVELRSLWSLVQRGTLLLLLDLVLVGALWLVSGLAEPERSARIVAWVRAWTASFRSRLSLALFAFFVVPAAVFGVWSSRQLQGSYRQARELLVFEALRAASADQFSSPTTRDDAAPAIARAAPLLLYRDGQLAEASDDLFGTLAPFGRLLPADVAEATRGTGHVETSRMVDVGESRVLVGYRAVSLDDGHVGVLAVPSRADVLGLDGRRRDLGVLVLFATLCGAFAALLLSGMAARQLARPIRTLRSAALAIASGERDPLPPTASPPAEFVPVFSAFRRMADDLRAGREALEEAERRTAAVLEHAASAVIAVDDTSRVTLFNPAAVALFGEALRSGTPLGELGIAELTAAVGLDSQRRGEATRELAFRGRQLQARVTPLAQGAGAVVTLDDVTDLARAQRVLAWGEMARQVAHEIKNPLTPIRLGVQHLRRAYHAGRGDYATVLEQNVDRILAEIDRLDQIARAFSRYGTAPGDGPVGEPTDIAAIVRDVVALERLGSDDVQTAVEWRAHDVDEPRVALARGDELREVLLNVLENARLAGAHHVDVSVVEERASGGVRIVVEDDGAGISADVLPRIFEPHFSTRTSGSGLGLAISRRLVEGWGGTIEVRSELGAGAEVAIVLAAVPR